MPKTDIKYSLSQVSENSFLLKFHHKFSNELSIYIAKCAQQVDKDFGDQILNSIPSYDALLITFQPYATGNFFQQIEDIVKNISFTSSAENRGIIEIPCYYHSEVAEFLDEVLEDMGMDIEEMIRLHTSQTFFVYMIGFCPGFAYMGDLPQNMQLPRRKVPQLKIPSGSVAIADFQTAIYPLEMPGGWHIIGRTPLSIFDATRTKTSLFKQGDRVNFKAINKEEFLQLGGQI